MIEIRKTHSLVHFLCINGSRNVSERAPSSSSDEFTLPPQRRRFGEALSGFEPEAAPELEGTAASRSRVCG